MVSWCFSVAIRHNYGLIIIIRSTRLKYVHHSWILFSTLWRRMAFSLAQLSLVRLKKKHHTTFTLVWIYSCYCWCNCTTHWPTVKQLISSSKESPLTSDAPVAPGTGNEDAAHRPVELHVGLLLLITMIIFCQHSEEQGKHKLNDVCVSGVVSG